MHYPFEVLDLCDNFVVLGFDGCGQVSRLREIIGFLFAVVLLSPFYGLPENCNLVYPIHAETIISYNRYLHFVRLRSPSRISVASTPWMVASRDLFASRGLFATNGLFKSLRIRRWGVVLSFLVTNARLRGGMMCRLPVVWDHEAIWLFALVMMMSVHWTVGWSARKILGIKTHLMDLDFFRASLLLVSGGGLQPSFPVDCCRNPVGSSWMELE